MMQKLRVFVLVLTALLFLTGCQKNSVVVTGIDEREANEIVVFLASKGIASSKVVSSSGGPVAGGSGGVKWNIMVDARKATDAMAFLNQNGLPRIKGPNLLDLFAKQGMMSSDKEDSIRYQAGLSEQIAGTIRKIDGVIDASVQISFPSTDSSNAALPWEQTAPQKITAAVYVKHQGIIDDPNSHLVIKIKRLVAGSVNGLDINDVTVISDRARFADITLGQTPETLSSTQAEQDYVSIWSIVMSKSSANRFRKVFFFLCLSILICAVVAAWLIWKMYPTLKAKGGLKQLLEAKPFIPEAAVPPPQEALEEIPSEKNGLPPSPQKPT